MQPIAFKNITGGNICYVHFYYTLPICRKIVAGMAVLESRVIAIQNEKRPVMGYEQIAAVDLGSNSFRLEIGRIDGDQIYSLGSLKESIRLASGLTRDKRLDEQAQQRGLETLGRFAERLR